MDFNVCKEKCGMTKCVIRFCELGCMKSNGSPWIVIELHGRRNRCVFSFGCEERWRGQVEDLGRRAKELITKKVLKFRYDLSYEGDPAFEVKRQHDFMFEIGCSDKGIWWNHEFIFKPCPFADLHNESSRQKHLPDSRNCMDMTLCLYG